MPKDTVSLWLSAPVVTAMKDLDTGSEHLIEESARSKLVRCTSTTRMCKAQENRSQNSKRTTKGICACYENNHTACNRTQRHYKGPSEITRGNGTKYNQNRVLAALSPFPYLLVRCHAEHRALHQTGKCCSTSAVIRPGTNEDNKKVWTLN